MKLDDIYTLCATLGLQYDGQHPERDCAVFTMLRADGISIPDQAFGVANPLSPEAIKTALIRKIQWNNDRRTRASTLPRKPIRVIDVKPDRTVHFEMDGQPWITRFAWTGSEAITTGNAIPFRENQK